MKSVTIAIGTFNRLEYTKRTLESIIKNTVIPYSIIIVDDGSDNETISYLDGLAKDKKIKLIKNKTNTWVAHVFNQKRYFACREGKEYICLLDNDVEVSKGWLGILIESYELLKKYWKGYQVPILKGFNRGEEVYGEVYEYEGVRFARAPICGGLAWLMETKTAIQDVERDLIVKMDLGFNLGMNYIDNRNYRKRLKGKGFEDAFVLLKYPSLVDHVGKEGVNTSRKNFPRGSQKKGQFYNF